MKRIGVIGVGYLGQHHARILREFEDIELYGVVDFDIERARHVAGLYGCKAFRDYRDILDRVDAVSIVTPTTTHYEIARSALSAGKDVFVEKPITHVLHEAEELVKIAKDKGRILQVGHLERYNPAYQKSRDYIGLPLFIIGERLSPFSGRGTDVDITFDLMIHDMDIIIDILRRQRVKEFRTSGHRLITERIDFATCWLDFENTSVFLMASRVAMERKRTLTIFCRDYGIVIDFMNQSLKRFMNSGGAVLYEDIPVEKKEPLREELRDFVECINSRRCPLVSAEDVLYPLSLVIEITEHIKLLNP